MCISLMLSIFCVHARNKVFSQIASIHQTPFHAVMAGDERIDILAIQRLSNHVSLSRK